MLIIMSMVVTTTIISFTMMMICSMISKKMEMDREKMSPFECGFYPMSSPRMPFSVQFFMIAVLFLIFDIELAILMPIMITMSNYSSIMWITTVMSFLIMLIMGLYHEWKNGILEWN
uniref:NADH dehydrogenase subunit 3 n=1 Tax=Urochelellus acutihumeralis TaxID=3020186 RepID=UPI0024114CC5|nr:NADH dehydrogenase subunit 3 [Urochelellus acutihumeralis]WEM32432.1 NADH dehydrogenase subunit 3 [Urochelellus acutihumeralis]